MAWVKKNLVILIAAVVSLGLLGYALVFVRGKVETDKEVAGQLEESAGKFKDLLSRKQHPGNEKVNNIEIAKGELVTMRTFMDEMREYLKGPEQPTNMNNQIFRAKLDTSIAEMRRMAEEANVALPNTNFWFTFTAYKTTVDFKGDAPGLTAELEDIKAIMKILCASRVQSLAGLKRGALSETEYMGTSDYINRYPRTNDWAVSTPYEVTFQGFSSELARVMEGFANAKECFVVKSLGVAQAPEERKPGAPAPAPFIPPPMSPYGPYGRGGMMGGPYGPRGPGMFPPVIAQPAPQQAARTSTSMQRVLDENKLRFTVQVDSIRLKPKGK